jgi:hypothetical protein
MHVQGGSVSNPTCASPTLHTAPLPQIPFIPTLIQDCTKGLTLSHLLHLSMGGGTHMASTVRFIIAAYRACVSGCEGPRLHRGM